MAVGPVSREEDEAFEGEHELAFADTAADRLPWLESDDDEEEAGGGSVRLFALAVIGAMALVLLLGGLWWLTRAHPDTAQVADGGTIAAPPGPYKVKPAEPGGRQVAGTGDTSFQVAEGHEVEGHIAETPSASPSPSAGATASGPPPSGAVGVQVGAYSTKAQAEAGWTQLAGRLPPLSGRSHRIVEGTADSGTVFRLQAVSGNVADAETLCHAIRSAGGDCQVKR